MDLDAFGIVLLIFASGCFGGFANALITGELKLPRRDAKAHVWHPGWVGNVLVGGLSALVVWGLYGPAAQISVIGDGGNSAQAALGLKIGELCGALITGVGGGRILTSAVDTATLHKGQDALAETRDKLIAAVDAIVERQT